MLTVVYIALVAGHIHWDTVSALPGGTTQEAVGALVFLMTGFGLGWVNVAADYSRYLPRRTGGGPIVWWTTFGGALAPIVLLVVGLLLAGSSKRLSSAIAADPVGGLAQILPTWFLVPFIIVAVLGLVGGAVLDIYSSGLALLSAGLPAPRWFAALIDGTVMILGSIYVVFVADDFLGQFIGFLTTLGVPVAAWCGVMLADVALRRGPYDDADLFAPAGRYGDIRWLPVLVVLGWHVRRLGPRDQRVRELAGLAGLPAGPVRPRRQAGRVGGGEPRRAVRARRELRRDVGVVARRRPPPGDAARPGAGPRHGMSEPWLVVIDMQHVFADPGSPWHVPRFADTLAPIRALVDAFAPRVTFTRFVAPAEPAGAWVAYYREFAFALQPPDAPLYALVAGVRRPRHARRPHPGQVDAGAGRARRVRDGARRRRHRRLRHRHRPRRRGRRRARVGRRRRLRGRRRRRPRAVAGRHAHLGPVDRGQRERGDRAVAAQDPRVRRGHQRLARADRRAGRSSSSGTHPEETAGTPTPGVGQPPTNPRATRRRFGAMRKLAAWCHDRRRTVIGLWVAAFVLLGVLWGAAAGGYVNSFRLPGTESQRAYDLLKDRFPQQSGDTASVVFAVKDGRVLDHRAAIERARATIAKSHEVVGVGDPFAKGAPVSRDGRITFAQIQFRHSGGDIDVKSVKAMTQNTLALDGKDGVQIALGGDTIHWASAQQGGAGEVIGILVAAGVLFLTLGIVAMWLPLINALFAMVVSLALMAVLGTRLIDVTDWTPQLAAMIGIGVGIDYALLILNRFRLERGSGRDVREGTRTALDTSGRAVLFAGIVVVIAMLGMILLGLSFLYSPAIGAALSVLATMGAALTLIPALLSRWAGGSSRRRTTATATWPTARPASRRAGASFVARRPLPVAIAALAVLLALAAPALHMRLASSDAEHVQEVRHDAGGLRPAQAGFGAGFNGAAAARLRAAQRATATRSRRSRLRTGKQPGIARCPRRPSTRPATPRR